MGNETVSVNVFLIYFSFMYIGTPSLTHSTYESQADLHLDSPGSCSVFLWYQHLHLYCHTNIYLTINVT